MILELARVAKTFTMHLQGGIRLPIVQNVSFCVTPGECVVLTGPSGAGKSSILKMIFGTYRCDEGRIVVSHGGASTDIAAAPPRDVLRLRRSVIGYVSQFLRAVPRVPALAVVAESGDSPRAEALLRRLNIPERLWSLPPATFSGGEQQRVNIARGFLPERPLLLLDEPTASLDPHNRQVVIDLISEKKRQGTAMVAIVHDQQVCDAVADRVIDVTRFAAA
ncbi:MAG TPA: phosphonate C-P lyase system protein PhnL [Xanthobacteraceae bacterium]|nr:phosphonate C-P lyase system protein PhnL [Xanthobacteraceae bacterium]